MGKPSDRLDFGAHDFRGGSSDELWQESISGNTSGASDGQLHNVAVVVTTTNATFYLNGKMQSVVNLRRPVSA